MIKPSYTMTIFDSGLGGLSILPTLQSYFPDAAFQYLADHQFFPYGNKSPQEISQRLSLLLPSFTQQYPSDIVILACNTVSTQALSQVRNFLKQPVAGVVPAIKPAAEQSKSKSIGILATPATIASPYTKDLISKFAPHCKITMQASHYLAELAEQFILKGRHPSLEMLRHETQKLKFNSVDTVALACTHYPLIFEFIKSMLPEVSYWTEPSLGLAKQVYRILKSQEAPEEPSIDLQNQRTISLYSTNQPFTKKYKHINFSASLKIQCQHYQKNISI